MCSKDIEELAIGFADILRPTNSVHEGTDSRDLMDTAAGILDLIQKASAFVVNYIAMPQTGRILLQSKASVSDMIHHRS